MHARTHPDSAPTRARTFVFARPFWRTIDSRLSLISTLSYWHYLYIPPRYPASCFALLNPSPVVLFQADSLAFSRASRSPVLFHALYLLLLRRLCWLILPYSYGVLDWSYCVVLVCSVLMLIHVLALLFFSWNPYFYFYPLIGYFYSFQLSKWGQLGLSTCGVLYSRGGFGGIEGRFWWCWAVVSTMMKGR